MSNIIAQNKFYVYQLRLENSEEPFYIGKGCGNRLSEHFQQWSINIKSHKNNIIKKAIKNGIIIVAEKLHENLTGEEAFDLEVSYIAMYGRLDIGTGILANHTDGGEGTSGYIFSKETRSKLSKNNSRENNPMYGKCMSEAARQKMSIAKRGIKHPFFGKQRDIVTRQKISKNSAMKKLNSWETPSVTNNAIALIWSKAIELYSLFVIGYNTKCKLANYLNLPPSMCQCIIDKFNKGWIPEKDSEWSKNFK